MGKNNVKKMIGAAKVVAFVLLGSTSLLAQTIDQGLKQIQADKIKDARNTFMQILNKEPNNIQALFYLAKIDLKEGKKDQAVEMFGKAAQADKKSPYFYVAQGFASMVKGDSANAFEQFDEAIDEVKAKDLKVIENIADAYVLTESRNLKRPVDMLTKIKSNMKIEFTQKAGIYEKLGDLYFKHGNYSQAISNYKNAIDANSSVLFPYVGVGSVYVRIKNYGEAETYLNNALQADSTYAPAYKELAELYYTQNKYVQSADMYKKYIQYSDADLASKIRYAQIAYLSKNYQESLAALKAIENEDPKNATIKHVIAWSYYSLDDAANAVPAFEQYFAVATEKEVSATDCEYYAKMLVKAGQETKAVDYYKKAIDLDSSRTDLYGDIAGIYFRSKDYSSAARYYEEKMNSTSKALSVRDIRDLFDFGQAYFHLKEYVKADTVFSKITQIKDDIAQAHLWRAIVNSSIDSTSEMGLAKPHYEKFIELANKTPDKYTKNLAQAHAYLGYFYYLKRDDPQYKDTWEAEYKTNWEKVLQYDPENAQAKEALKNTNTKKK